MEGDERATLHALLQYQRDSLVKKVRGVSEAAARQTPLPSGTNLLWLTKHMARAESLWVLHRFAGHDAPLEDDRLRPEDTVESAIAAYEATWQEVDPVVAATPDLDAPCRIVGDGPPRQPAMGAHASVGGNRPTCRSRGRAA